MQILAITPYFFVVLTGLVIGSFLNVVIYRLPRMIGNSQEHPQTKNSIFNLAIPRSHCPHCQHPLRIRENIPLLSFIFLRGKCAQCQGEIAWQYPFMEALSACLALTIILYFGFTFTALANLCFVFILLPLIFIDIRHQILPDILTLSLLWIGLLNAVFVGSYASSDHAILGVIIGYSVFYIFNLIFSWIAKKPGLGYGDFKLLAALGAWFGIQALPFIIFASAAGGAIVGITLILLKKKTRQQPIPYGPFLALAGFVYLFFQPQIYSFYNGL